MLKSNPMLKPKIFTNTNEALDVLCIGAHCDDIEIGCGGSILSMLNQNPNINLHWHIFTSSPDRKQEALAGARLFGAKAKSLSVNILDFPDGYLPYEGREVKQAMEAIKQSCSPDLIFTHYRHDLHQDHRKIAELTWNTFRNHLIMEYEIPKWDGDMGQPNTFIEIDKIIAEEKIRFLQEAYNSQQKKRWFTDDLFYSMMRIRGMECNSGSQLAEAFYMNKTVLSFTTPKPF